MRIVPEALYLSLVIPAYNEQENIPTLLARVEAALDRIGKPYEVILIDDGSSDETPKLLNDAMQSDHIHWVWPCWPVHRSRLRP
jgi:glycosyltransferase involved in cell wall biosynthesis